jgi:hypothetical protein
MPSVSESDEINKHQRILGPLFQQPASAPYALETDLSQADDPEQGARLVRAFLRITDPRVRLAIIHMVEKMESAPADC